MANQNEANQPMLKATHVDHNQQPRQQIDLQAYKESRLSSYVIMSWQRDQDGWI
jgi:hypothetical protein